MSQQPFAIPALVCLALWSSCGIAGSRVTHHGGLILDCEPPKFYDHTPSKDARVAAIQNFSVVASDNTDSETIKVRANNEPVEVKITRQRSGTYLIEGTLREPVAEGKVWFRVNAESVDGCDDYSAWNVYVGD